MNLAKHDKIYAYTVSITSSTEYGSSLEAILGGTARPRPEGARFDVSFAGKSTGRLAGTVEGIDYLNVRADGRLEIDVRATLTTDDGATIALAVTGVGTPAAGSPIVQIRQSGKLHTSHEKYLWANGVAVWASGSADLSRGEVSIEAVLA